MRKKKICITDADLILWALLITLVQIVGFDKTPTGWWAFLATGSAARMPLYLLQRGSHRGMLLACSSPCLRGKACVLHTTMCTFDFVSVRAFVAVCVSACVMGAGTVMDRKHTPIPQPPWPCSLTPYSYIFFSLPLLPTPITQTRNTHTHASTAPVAPPRLQGEEKGEQGPTRGEGGRGGRGGRGATRGEPALVQPSEALLVRVTDLRWHQH